MVWRLSIGLPVPLDVTASLVMVASVKLRMGAIGDREGRACNAQ